MRVGLEGRRLEFFTDVEGNWDYYCALVERSTVLSFVDKARGWEVALADDGLVVFGGDACDRGEGDIRVVRSLVDLKTNHPDRVFLVLGNRDVNKLRFWSELAPGETGANTDVYWNPKHTPFVDYCAEHGLPTHGDAATISTLKWMLHCTMGCDTTFATRRRELALLRLRDQQGGAMPDPATPADALPDVSDHDVLASLRGSVDPSAEAGDAAWMLRLVELGDIAVVVGDCLFVHGALRKDQVGMVPAQGKGFGFPNSEPRSEKDAVKWAEALREWKDNEVADYRAHPCWEEVSGKRVRGGEGLLDYGVPGGAHNLTVVFNNWLEDGNCADLDPEVEEWLLASGIERVFTGHQPHGQCPSVIRTARGVQVVMADTSYSDVGADKSINPANFRGRAVTNVLVTSQATHISGVLSDGAAHGCVLHPLSCKEQEDEADEGDHWVGRRLKGDWWVKTVRRDEGGSVVVIAKGKGWKVEMDVKKRDEVEALLV